MFKFRATDEEFREIEPCGVASTAQQGVQLSALERKLVARFNERQSRRSNSCQQLLRNLPTMTFFQW